MGSLMKSASFQKKFPSNSCLQTGPEGMAEAFTALFNLAMRMERDRHLGAGRYERSDARQGYANGYKPKKVDRPAGTVTVQVPKSRGCDEPFFPQSLERGRRSSRAIMLAIAEMYVRGVSTRDAAKVMKEFGLESMGSYRERTFATRMLQGISPFSFVS